MIEQINIQKIYGNPVNPRLIKEDKFKKLVKSIQEFPEMLKLRPIVVNNEYGILGGNMRYKACLELGLKTVWVIKADNLTEEQMQQFVIKDNVSSGEWDWDVLANQWKSEELNDWGMEVWNPSLNTDFIPEYSPNSDQKQLTKEEYEQRKQELQNKNLSSERSLVDCICPNCYHEFNIESK